MLGLQKQTKLSYDRPTRTRKLQNGPTIDLKTENSKTVLYDRPIKTRKQQNGHESAY